jgi:hypothetical protein
MASAPATMTPATTAFNDLPPGLGPYPMGAPPSQGTPAQHMDILDLYSSINSLMA